jgi:hypothetical protein
MRLQQLKWLAGMACIALGLASCEDQPNTPSRSPIETLSAFYDAVNKGDSARAAELSTEERKATMHLIWPLLMRDVKKGIEYRVEIPEVVEYSPDSLACDIYYDRIEFDLKADSARAIRRDYRVTAVKADGEWLLYSGSDNPFPAMLNEDPEAFELLQKLRDSE